MNRPRIPAPTGAIDMQMGRAEWAQLLFLSLIWGASFFLIAIAVTGLPVVTIVTLRVGIAAAVLWLVVALTGRALPREPGIWGAFLVMGLLNSSSGDRRRFPRASPRS